jgi:hypothetical protein
MYCCVHPLPREMDPMDALSGLILRQHSRDCAFMGYLKSVGKDPIGELQMEVCQEATLILQGGRSLAALEKLRVCLEICKRE